MLLVIHIHNFGISLPDHDPSTSVDIYFLGTPCHKNVIKEQLVICKRLQIYFLSVSDTLHLRRYMTRQDKGEYRRAKDPNRPGTSFHLLPHKRLTSCPDILSM